MMFVHVQACSTCLLDSCIVYFYCISTDLADLCPDGRFLMSNDLSLLFCQLLSSVFLTSVLGSEGRLKFSVHHVE